MPSDSLLPEPDGDSLIATPETKPPKKLTLRAFGDHDATRKAIYDNVFSAVNELEPLVNDRHTLRLRNPRWQDPDHFSVAQRKQAILTGGTLARRLKGTWELTDNATGQVIDSRDQVVARVPHLTELGTFVHNGNDYTLNHQQRLNPGAFVRRKNNGEIEAHANILPGKGVSHRYLLDPDKGIFKISLAQAEMPLLPLLKAMGARDDELREAWGPALFAVNYQKAEHGVLNKLAQRILPKADREHPDEDHRRQKLVAAFAAMETDPWIMQRTLGHPHRGMTKDAIIDTTRKLLAVSRGEADVDDRDHLAYQSFHGPEDLFAERIRRDHGRLRRQLFFKASLKGHLRDFPSSALTPQLEQALLLSGLGQHLEEINPGEVFDKQSRITRMGEGGIPAIESIPEEARSVQPSHMGYIDPVRTPESFRAGVDVNLARGARKGSDGRIYAQFRNVRTGKAEWKSPLDLADEVIAFPGSLRTDSKRVPVLKAGKIGYATRDQVSYELPHFEDAFSPLANLVPMKSAMKGQRVAMGSRYLSQALPLLKPEAPLVRGAVPGSQGQYSFEEEYGHHLGALHAPQGGRVLAVSPDAIRVRYDDGSTDTKELYDNYPFNRKTYFQHTPLVKPGDAFRPGQLLAKSNYTDDHGAAALGANLRVAYLPWKGYNFEDAVVISEATAKRLTSTHMYQHDLMLDEKHKLGKRNFISLFPSRYERQHLDALDDHGLVQPGTTVEQGQPLILAARERELAENKVHKKGQAGHVDASVVWDHHDPGVVTDVVHGKDGPVVLVKSTSAMQVGDKLSGRHGNKGVVSLIVPDHQMPHDKDGRPFEILMNPLGTVSRTNPSNVIEAMLGKVAAHTGRPVNVPDFEDIDDLSSWARRQLIQHGLSDTEDIVDPEHQNRIPGVATGNAFFMKLEHTAESKGQGRGAGAYGSDETPSKGGPTGCFTGDVTVQTERGFVPIARLVECRMTVKLATRYVRTGVPRYLWQRDLWKPATDWFEYRVPAAHLVEITLANRQVLCCTRNHEFVLADGTRKPAGQLQPGDDLME